MKANSTLLTVVCCLFISATLGCKRPGQATVFCAASLTSVVREITPSDKKLRIHSGGSQHLVSQYYSGAETDLLLLADASLVEALPSERKLRTAVIAGNRLVLATRRSRPVGAKALTDPKTVLALADPEVAPLGRYSRQALSQTSISAQKVYLKDATAVLAALHLGHAELGVVYASDLNRWPELEEVPSIDLSRHDPIQYAAVLLKPAHPEALKLFELLTSETGREALQSAGFIPHNQPASRERLSQITSTR